MCELEQHVMMLRESGGPLSPGRILSHMRSISCQIGDGSQEDAHEFLRSLRIDKLIFFFVSSRDTVFLFHFSFYVSNSI